MEVIDPLRYETLKKIVYENVYSGRLSQLNQISLHPVTLDFVSKSQKDPYGLLLTYCAAKGVPPYQFYVFELGGDIM